LRQLSHSINRQDPMTRRHATLIAAASTALVAGVAIFLAMPGGTFPQSAGPDVTIPDSPQPAAGIAASRDAAAATKAPAKRPSPAPPPAVFERHAKAVAAMAAQSLENAKRVHAAFFEAQGLSRAVQDQVAAILALPERMLADEALAAMRAGTLPTPPSPEMLHALKSRQDEELRSLLGEGGLAALENYRTTIPDRIIVDGMTRQGAALTEDQSQQLLAILNEERRKAMGSPAAARNFQSLPPSQALALIRQDQEKLRDAVSRRAESILDAGQAAMLGDVFNRLAKLPRPR
jgi:hypothetical protein